MTLNWAKNGTAGHVGTLKVSKPAAPVSASFDSSWNSLTWCHIFELSPNYFQIIYSSLSSFLSLSDEMLWTPLCTSSTRWHHDKCRSFRLPRVHGCCELNSGHQMTFLAVAHGWTRHDREMESRRKTALAGLGHHLASEIQIAGDSKIVGGICRRDVSRLHTQHLNIDFAT